MMLSRSLPQYFIYSQSNVQLSPVIIQTESRSVIGWDDPCTHSDRYRIKLLCPLKADRIIDPSRARSDLV